MKLNKILHSTRNKDERIPMFIDELDRLSGGLLVGGISVIAGRPAMGKTTFAMTVVKNVGIMNKIPTAVLSMMENEDYTAKRLMATLFGWERSYPLPLQSAQLTEGQEDKIAMLQRIGFESNHIADSKLLEMVKSAPVWIEHGLGVDMDEIISRMERLKKENDIKLLVIDSFGWIAPENTIAASESAMLKLIYSAEKLGIAVLMTCDLTRAVEMRGGCKKPILPDLRDNALIEKYSTLVMFLYRPEYYQILEDEYGSTLNKAYVIVAKNRRGNIGEVRLDFVDKARFDRPTYSPYNAVSPFGVITPSTTNPDEVFF